MPLDGSHLKYDEVKLALVNARHYAELDWCQRAPISAHGGFCAFGAIRQATKGWDGNDIFWLTIGLFASILPSVPGGDSVGTVTYWNDTAGRTKEEVLAKFDEAIELS